MKVIAVIPAYNECHTIAAVIEGCRKLTDEVIVVNDGSRDDTAIVAARAGAKVVNHLINRGYGAAVWTGMQAAIAHGGDIIVTIDADGQHDPLDITAVIRPILSQAADVAIGNRFDPASIRTGMPRMRRLLITLANVYTWFLYGTRLSDTQSGLRAYHRSAIASIDPQSGGMEFASEILGELLRMRLRIAEVPMHVRYSTYSLSKGQNFTHGVRTGLKLFLRKVLR